MTWLERPLTEYPFTSDSIVAISLLLVVFAVVLFFFKMRSKKQIDALGSQPEIYERILDTTDEAILVLSPSFKIVYANSKMIKLLGLRSNYKEKKLAKSVKVKLKSHWFTIEALINSQLINQESMTCDIMQTELDTLKEENKFTPINLHMIQNVSLQSEWKYFIAIQDLTYEEEQKVLENRHKLTGLPNQNQALKDLNALYAKTHLMDGKIILILLEIDNFSKLQSILGYDQSNRIVIKLSKYLAEVSNKYKMGAYHTYPNNFLLVMTQVDDEQVALNFIEEVQSELKEFYKMEDVRLHLSVSAGISIYPDSGNTRSLFDNAHKALVEAKSHGHGQVVNYMPEQASFVFDELTLYNEMHLALEKNEFVIYFQPIVDAKTKEIVSAEALIRWVHPVHGLIPPNAFIPIMEKTGFINEIGKYVLDEVIRQQKRWEMFKFKQISVTINVSLIEVETGNFFEHVEKKLQETKLDPDLITFEVTEGNAMANEKNTINEFKKLNELGARIALDDFGTGYTSFSHLKKFPAQILKIDRSFVEHILVKPEDQRIVQGMIELAHNLQMKVVVEGIENQQVSQLLESYGCDYMQGYYFSRPLPVFEFQKLLREERII